MDDAAQILPAGIGDGRAALHLHDHPVNRLDQALQTIHGGTAQGLGHELVLVCRFSDTKYQTGITRKELPKLNYLFCNFALQEVGLFIRQLFPDNYQFPFEIDNSTKLLDFVLAGLGYSFLPLSLVKKEINAGRLRMIPLLDFDSPIINNYLTMKEGMTFPFDL